FEQVLPAAPALSGLLGSAPGLNLLVTSRTPLRMAGERTYSVPPLEESESVNLFVERAQAADAGFEVTDANAQDVAEICARLEAAEALRNADLDILAGLQSLVENSLLRRRADSDGEPRFWMLETIREYACELLEAEGDADDAQRRHAEYLAEEAERLDLES